VSRGVAGFCLGICIDDISAVLSATDLRPLLLFIIWTELMHHYTQNFETRKNINFFCEKVENSGKSSEALKIQNGQFENRRFRDSISPSSGPT
jgi:hypothetical protein